MRRRRLRSVRGLGSGEFERIVLASFTLREIRALGWPGESPLVARVREWTR
jgi:hypothetical protein